MWHRLDYHTEEDWEAIPVKHYRCIKCWRRRSRFGFPLITSPKHPGEYRHSLFCIRCFCGRRYLRRKRK